MRARLLIIILMLIFSINYGNVYGISSDENKLYVVSTTTILTDAITNVGGDHINIKGIIGVGVDPHAYEPTSEATVAISEADIIIYLGIEENLLTTLDNMDNAYDILSSIPDEYLLNFTGESGSTELDPHFWQDPVVWKIAVERIRDILIDNDAADTQYFTDNADSYLKELDILNDNIENKVSELNSTQKFLVTQHAAFQYYAKRYGFNYRSLKGISTEDEAGIKEIQDLAQYLKDNHIQVIFLESEVPNEQAQAVIDAAANIGWTVGNGGTLYTGSLGPDGSEADTYLKMMMVNTNTIVNGIKEGPVNTVISSNNNVAPLVSVFIFISLFITAVVNRQVAK